MRNFAFALLFASMQYVSNAQNNQYSLADSAYILPDSSCVTCNGSVWISPMRATTGNISRSFLLPKNQCDEDTCYYTREFRFCNYGFNIPANATIDSFWVYVGEGATVNQVILDSVVQLIKNHTPCGINAAYPYLWLTGQSVYYVRGLWGCSWTPQEVNDPGFGLVARAKNNSNDTASALVVGSNISVWYNTGTGIEYNQESPCAFFALPNPAHGQVRLIINDPFHAGIHTIDIYNSMGESVGSIRFEGNFRDVDVTNLPGGIYYLRTTLNGNIYFQKLLLQ